MILRIPFQSVARASQSEAKTYIAGKGWDQYRVERRPHTACDRLLHSRRMRRPIGSTLVAGLCAAACSLSAVDGTRAFDAGAWEVAQGGQDCHRSFPAFLWAGSKTGGNVEVCERMCGTQLAVAASLQGKGAAVQNLATVLCFFSRSSSFAAISCW